MQKLFLLFYFFSTSILPVFSQQYAQRYEQCSEGLKGLEPIDSIYNVKARQRDSCLLGVQAPDFKVKDINGNEIQLSNFKGRIVMLNFWFTRCSPCIQEIPAFNKLVEKYSGKGIAFISFTYDSVNILKEFLNIHPFNFIAVSDDNVRRENFRLFGVWPYTIVIDKEDRISDMLFGSLGQYAFKYYTEIFDELLK